MKLQTVLRPRLEARRSGWGQVAISGEAAGAQHNRLRLIQTSWFPRTPVGGVISGGRRAEEGSGEAEGSRVLVRRKAAVTPLWLL